MDKQTCGWVCIIAGIWLILAPFVLGYSANVSALWNEIIIGVILLGVGSAAFSGKKS